MIVCTLRAVFHVCSRSILLGKVGEMDDLSNDEADITPNLNVAASRRSVSNCINPMNLSSELSHKWSPGSWQDANRKSAFTPYKQTLGTVLTNLQRGNTQAETPVSSINIFTKHLLSIFKYQTRRRSIAYNTALLKNKTATIVCGACAQGGPNSIFLWCNSNSKCFNNSILQYKFY